MPDNVSENFERTDDDSDNSIFRRPVRTFVIRAGRLTTSERKSYDELHHVWCIPYEHKTLNYTEIFNNTNPVIMEIGFGMGHATSIIAENNPDINYIGSEVHVPGVGRLLGDIKTKLLNSLYIVEHDDLDILKTKSTDNPHAGFHMFFPDPWPKKKHHKRRMLQRPRTDLLAKKLAPGGYLYFATDWQEYAESALEELKMTEGLANKYEGYAPHQEWRPRTKFEQKGLDAGRDIYELFFVKE